MARGASPIEHDVAVLRFDAFELELSSGELHRDGVTVSLPPQPFRLLVLLASRAGELVTREQIRTTLWGGETFVQYEGSLNFCISQLRAALRETAGEPRLIETLRGRGYRFNAAVEVVKVGPGRSRLAAGRVAAALAIAALALVAIGSRERATAPQPASTGPSLGVVPFASASGDPDEQRFAAGLRDDLVESLSRLPDLRAVTLAFEPGPEDRVRVSTLLSASVDREGGRLRVGARLRDATTRTVIWSHRYRKPLDEAFDIRRDLVERVAQTLEIRLTPGNRAALARQPTSDVRAFDYYLRGRDFYSRYRRAENENAIQLYRRALELDSEFALAHAELANALAQRVFQLGPNSEWSEQAVASARRALELEPQLAQGYKALGLALSTRGRQAEAIEAYRAAVTLRPGYPEALNNLAALYFSRGEWPAALMWVRRRVRIDPQHEFSTAVLAKALLELGYREEAFVWLDRLAESDPTNASLHVLLARDELRRGDIAAARARMDRMRLLHRDEPEVWMLAGLVELVAGQDERAEHLFRQGRDVSGHTNPYAELRLAELLWRRGERERALPVLKRFERGCLDDIEAGNQSWTRPWTLALIAAVRGDRTAAVEWLETAVEAGHLDYAWDLKDPAFRALHDEQGFQQVVERMRNRIGQMKRRVADEGLAIRAG